VWVQVINGPFLGVTSLSQITSYGSKAGFNQQLLAIMLELLKSELITVVVQIL